MKMLRHDVAICAFLTATTLLFYAASSQFQGMGLDAGSSSWFYRLVGNMFGYASVLIPGYISMKYIRRVNYAATSQKGCLWPLIRDCIYGQETVDLSIIQNEKSDKAGNHVTPTFAKSALLIVYCFSGLQISYLTWGLLQEKIITHKYDGHSFSDSQFLVFVNRVIGLLIASIYISFYEQSTGHQTQAKAPLYKYSFCAFSNIMSSWFQYEALKFVSFPTQVLAKASKIIPVMLMGKLISKKTYQFYEYITALLISVGMVLFLAGSDDYIKMTDPASSPTSIGISGLLILISYMAFDSFTSNWQSELFRVYGISSFRMMAGVNLFSLLLTGVSLIQQGTLTTNLEFLLNHNDFAIDCLILSICSAIGQLFIYYTIEKFGPVVFIIIMSIRQAFAILLSCMFFSHPITGIGIIGVFVIFFSLFLRIYCSYRMKQVRSAGQSAPLIKL